MIGSLKQLSTRVQLVALALVVLAFVLLAAVLNHFLGDNLLTAHRGNLDKHLQINSARLLQTTENLRQNTLFLARTPPVSGLIRAHFNHGIDPREGNSRLQWQLRLQEIFVAFIDAHPDYQSVSYTGLADGGLELVRVDRQAGHARVVPEQDLRRLAERSCFQEARALPPGQVHLSDFEADVREPGKRLLRSSTPIFTASGELFGLLTIRMNASALFEAMNSGLPEQVQTRISDESGSSLYAPASPGQSRPAESSLARLGEPSMQTIDSAQGRFYASTLVAPFDPRQPARHLRISYLLPAEALADSFSRIRLILLLSSLALAVALGTFIWFYLRHLMQPLATITRAARLIAAGKNALNLPRSGHSEILELANAFRHMIDRITARESDYQRLNTELEERIRQRTDELRLAANVLDNTSEGVMITDPQARMVAVNPAFTAITGYSAEEAVGQRPSLLRSAHHDVEFYQTMWAQLAREGHWSGEIWNRRKNGEVFLERLSINRVPGENGRPTHYVGIFNDITDLWHRDEQTRFLAYHDALTRLPNRTLFLDRLGHAMLVAEREHSGLALLFLDLDRFKQVNDRLGHDLGDLLLQEVARRIKTCLREIDTVARLGGDEFVILLENLTTREAAVEIANSLVCDLCRPYQLREQAADIGVSIGIALYPEHGREAELLIQHADQAMYAAKSAGRGVARVFGTAQDD